MSSLFAEAPTPGANYKVGSITDLSPQTLGELRSYIEQAGLAIPISQVTGFQQFTAQFASVAANESTSSTTFTDLATVGPTVSGLPAGKYVILFGCQYALPGSSCTMSIQVNSDAVSVNDGCTSSVTTSPGTSISRAVAKTLQVVSGGNTVTAKYKSDSGSSDVFQNRWLIALRYANK